jgi:hypothetical protein
MATYTAQRDLATKQSDLKQGKLKSDYDAYLKQLATQYGLSTENLASNLESRGILNSGEAGTARTRLAATDLANRTNAETDYTYNTNVEKNNLLQTLASMKSGTTTPTTPKPVPAPKDKVPLKPKPIAVAPTNVGNGMTYSNTGVYGAVYPITTRPIRDASPRPPRPSFRPVGPRDR